MNVLFLEYAQSRLDTFLLYEEDESLDDEFYLGQKIRQEFFCEENLTNYVTITQESAYGAGKIWKLCAPNKLNVFFGCQFNITKFCVARHV